MEIYPDSFPEPLVNGYGISVDAGLIRTQMQNGRPRQRRRYTSMPEQFSFNFAVPLTLLDSWQSWVNSFAYDWFEIDATSHLSGYTNKACTPHIVRFISDLQMTPMNEKVFRVSVQAEMAPTQVFNPTVPLTGNWIIAKTPPSPSTDWVIAQTPASPSLDWVVAGSPTAPAAII